MKHEIDVMWIVALISFAMSGIALVLAIVRC